MHHSEQIDNTGDDGPMPGTGVDAVLSLRFEPKALWPRLREALDADIDETSAALALSVYAEALSQDRWTSYSRRKAHYAEHAATRPEWANRASLYTYKRVVSAVDRMEASGLLVNAVAPSGTRDWQSKMRATPRLIETVRGVVRGQSPIPARHPAMGLVVRDEAGVPKPFRRTADTRRMERNLTTLNEAFASLRMEGAFPACAVRIYNQSLERGGRFYLDGGSVQCMPEAQRLRVTWDGERSGEVDYKCMHISMLYSDVGVAPPMDAYAIDGFPRPLVKIAVLVVVNAPTYRSALNAIAGNEKMATMARPKSGEALQIAARLMAALKHLHTPIAKFFHSGAGAFLMRREADVLEDVMLTMQARGEIVLPVHDSGLCRAGAVSSLEQAMIEASERAGLKRIRIDTTMASNDA